MTPDAQFKAAYPFQANVLALPVQDLDDASHWYATSFGMTEVERPADGDPTVILERDGVRIGFSVNGGDPTQDGAAILVQDIAGVRKELEERGVAIGNWRRDTRDGREFQVFFVVAPDGLCYYFHEPV